jgi:bifunctional non-homologous end joining protein LigD
LVGPDGLSQFEALRRRDAGQVAVLFAFDLIEHDGVDLRGHPFVARKAMLTHLLCDRVGHIQLNEHIAEDGPRVFEHACRLGAEGIVSRRLDASYRSGPCAAWVKVKSSCGSVLSRPRRHASSTRPRLPIGGMSSTSTTYRWRSTIAP